MLVLTRHHGEAFSIGDMRCEVQHLQNGVSLVTSRPGEAPERVELPKEHPVRLQPDIVVKFLARRGRQSAIGIDAPREILVLREELEKH